MHSLCLRSTKHLGYIDMETNQKNPNIKTSYQWSQSPKEKFKWSWRKRKYHQEQVQRVRFLNKSLNLMTTGYLMQQGFNHGSIKEINLRLKNTKFLSIKIWIENNKHYRINYIKRQWNYIPHLSNKYMANQHANQTWLLNKYGKHLGKLKLSR